MNECRAKFVNSFGPYLISTHIYLRAVESKIYRFNEAGVQASISNEIFLKQKNDFHNIGIWHIISKRTFNIAIKSLE